MLVCVVVVFRWKLWKRLAIYKYYYISYPQTSLKRIIIIELEIGRVKLYYQLWLLLKMCILNYVREE